MNNDLKILFVEDSQADAELAVNELKKNGLACVAKKVMTRFSTRPNPSRLSGTYLECKLLGYTNLAPSRANVALIEPPLTHCVISWPVVLPLEKKGQIVGYGL